MDLVSNVSFYECSIAQQRILTSKKVKLNNPIFVHLGKVGDKDKIQDALDKLVARHESLRTCFQKHKGEYLQKVYDHATISLIEAPEAVVDMKTLESSITTHNFDTGELPLIKPTLHRLISGECILVIDKHLIVSDQFSDAVLQRDFLQLYSNLSLTAPETEMIDFVLWQNETLTGSQGERAYHALLNSLAVPDTSAATQLNDMFTVAKNKARFCSNIDVRKVKLLKQLIKHHELDLRGILLACNYVLLSNRFAEKDIQICCVLPGRSEKLSESLVGYYENYVPVNIHLDKKLKFLHFWKNINEKYKLITKYQEFPVDHIQKNISRERLGVATVSNVGYTYKVSDDEPVIERFSTQHVCSSLHNFSLHIVVIEAADDNVILQAEYDTTVWSLDDIRKFASHFDNLLSELIINVDKEIYELSYISDEEEQDLLYSLNNTHRSYDLDVPVHKLFEQQVTLHGDLPAVVYDGESLTYTQLNERANRLARALIDKGLRKEQFVAVYMERGLDLAVAIMAIFKSGGIYVPIDTKYPGERVTELLNDCSPFAVIVNAHTLLPNHKLVVDQRTLLTLCIDEITAPKQEEIDLILSEVITCQEIALYSPANPTVNISSRDGAYMIYTSGSTGKPKGALLRHDGTVNHILAEFEDLELQPHFRFLQSANISSDISVWQIIGPLLHGGASVIVDQDTLLNYARLIDLLISERISLVEFVPSYLVGLIDYLEAFGGVRLPDLHWIMMVGEEVPVSLVNKWLSMFPDVPVVNGYGPAEASDDIAQYKIYQPLDNTFTKVPIGRPLANLNIFIVGEDMELLPKGDMGEIVVAGVGVGIGYWNDPHRTAEVFVKNPFSNKENDIIYRTGDLGRWREDDQLEFLGRKDRQIKLRGFRIELGEVEAVIQSFDGILDVAVDLRPDNTNTKSLVAYIILKNEYTIEQVRSHTKNVLPDHMVPAYFIQMDEFPQNLSDKVDYKNLPAPTKDDKIDASDYTPPRNDLELELTRIWQDILGYDKVGICNDFFELGGHSLKASQMMTRIYKHLDYEVKLKDIFENPTIASLADVLNSTTRRAYKQIPKTPEQNLYRISHAQKRLWVLHQFEENKNAYNLPQAYIFEGVLIQEHLISSYEELVRRHEILRTTFIEQDGEIYQKVWSANDIPLQFDHIDLRGSINPEQYADDVIKNTTGLQFNLVDGPLFAIKLIQIHDTKFIFVFNTHHIISDGWSEGVIVNEILELYSALCKNRPPELEPLRIQYKEYAAWQNRLIDNGEMQIHQEYWLRQFTDGVPVLQFPTEFPRPGVKTFNGDFESVVLSKACTSNIRSCAKEHRTSSFITLLTTVFVLLHKYTEQEDIVVGSPIAGRDHPDLEGQLGFYVNTLALRCKISKEDTFTDLLKEVNAMSLSAYQHDMYPFDLLVDDLKPRADTSRSPIFDVMVALQNTDVSLNTNAELDGIKVSNYKLNIDYSKFDLSFFFIEKNDNTTLTVEYNTDLFSKSFVKRLVHHYQVLVGKVSTHPNDPIRSKSLIDDDENQLLVNIFNKTSVAFPAVSANVVFEETVNRQPHQVAVEFDDVQLTYDVLNKKSNQLANYLLKIHHVKKSDKIAVILDRSEFMIISLLAILKSGSAYVPIDPQLPDNRINYILEDIDAKVIFTEKSKKTESSAEVIDIDKIHTSLKDFDTRNTGISILSTDLAYVIYTSGSTGVPKGVMVEHQGMVNRIDWMWKKYGFSRRDVVLQKTSFVFDVSVWEIFMTLCYGAKLVLCEREVIYDPSKIIDIIEKYEVTTIHFVPSMFNMFLETLNTEIKDRVKSLRHIFASGEALLREQVRKHYSLLSIPIHNLYGPTEASVDVTYYEAKVSDAIIPIGKPISNIQIYVLDSDLKCCPIGVEGEICIAGIGLARGYLNKPELTQERFIKNLFGNTDTEKLYKTGDTGKWRADGNIEFVGRKDDQVKIRGFRIELGEIQNVLLSHNAITEAVVIVQKEQGQDYYLAAFVVGAIGEQEVRFLLRSELPDYMVPTHIHFMDNIPLTSSGKADRKALMKFKASQSLPYAQVLSPRNKMESLLSSLFHRVTSNQIHISQDFFTNGGDSIKAIRLVNLIKNELKLNVRVSDIFQHSTIESLAYHLSADEQRYDDSDLEVGEKAIQAIKNSIHENDQLRAKLPVSHEDYYPMSDIQAGMVFHYLLTSGSGMYHDQDVNIFEDYTFDMALIRTAMAEMVKKHSVLRTSYDVENFSLPVQVVHQFDPIRSYIDFKDLSDKNPDDQVAFIKEFMKADRLTSFDLKEAHMWRLSYFKITNGRYVKFFAFHHAILDGWSNASLHTELTNTYLRLKNDANFKPPLLKCTYRDYIKEQLYYKGRTDIREFWDQYLKEYKRTELPFHKSIESILLTNEIDTHTFELAPAVVASVEQYAIDHQVSLQELLLSSFIYMLQVINNSREVTIGLVTNNRPEVTDGDKLLGCFLNTAPFRVVTPSLNSTIPANFIKEISENFRVFKRYDKISLVEINKVVDEKASNANPIFDVMFNYTEFHVYDEMINSEPLNSDRLKDGFEKDNTLFNFEVSNYKGGLAVDILTSPGLYNQYELVKIEKYYIACLALLINAKSLSLAPTSILLPDELKLLQSFNKTDKGFHEKTVWQYVQEFARTKPDKAAIKFSGKEVSYFLLNKNSNKWSNYIRKTTELVSNDRVAIVMDRSDQMAEIILAIWKLGASYIPVDPKLPASRILKQLKEAEVKLVIGTKTYLYQYAEGEFESALLFVEDFEITREKLSDLDLNIKTKPGDLAYVIFTSGSTGNPKGAMIEHAGMMNHIWAKINDLKLDENSIIAQNASQSFDISVWQFFAALVKGGTTVVYSDEEVFAPESFIETLKIDRVNVLEIVPSYLAVLLDVFEHKDSLYFSNLLRLVVTGEILKPELVNRWFKKFTGISMVNAYGPTEASDDIAHYTIDQPVELRQIPIGLPVQNMHIYIVDYDMNLCPLGVKGEICVAGIGVGRGYINDEERTRKVFLKNPFDDLHPRLYRTGDIGRWTSNGRMEFHGRIDHQVKIRGHRIELGEIENALVKLGMIKDAVVDVIESGNNKTLAGYVVSDAAQWSESEARAGLKKLLPEYMIPSKWMVLDHIPLTQNGKVDRKQLACLEFEERQDRIVVKPENELEEELLLIWEEVLGKNNLGVQDNFFENGGNSILAMQLITRINARIGSFIELRDIFSYPTIKSLYWLIESIRTNSQENGTDSDEIDIKEILI